MQREQIAAFSVEEDERLARYVVGFAWVSQQNDHNVPAKLVAWRKPPPFPRVEHCSLGEAMACAKEQLTFVGKVPM